MNLDPAAAYNKAFKEFKNKHKAGAITGDDLIKLTMAECDLEMANRRKFYDSLPKDDPILKSLFEQRKKAQDTYDMAIVELHQAAKKKGYARKEDYAKANATQKAALREIRDIKQAIQRRAIELQATKVEQPVQTDKLRRGMSLEEAIKVAYEYDDIIRKLKDEFDKTVTEATPVQAAFEDAIRNGKTKEADALMQQVATAKNIVDRTKGQLLTRIRQLLDEQERKEKSTMTKNMDSLMKEIQDASQVVIIRKDGTSVVYTAEDIKANVPTEEKAADVPAVDTPVEEKVEEVTKEEPVAQEEVKPLGRRRGFALTMAQKRKEDKKKVEPKEEIQEEKPVEQVTNNEARIGILQSRVSLSSEEKKELETLMGKENYLTWKKQREQAFLNRIHNQNA